MNNHAFGTTLRRRDEIRKLVRQGAVRSQAQLRASLSKRGIRVTQPTLSRDIREMGLAKTARGYVTPDANLVAFPNAEHTEPSLRLVHEFVLGAKCAANLVVLSTPPAAAHPVARALDEAQLADVVGTVAGDDTIFVATPNAAAARRVARRLTAELSRPHPRSRRPRR